MTSTASRRNSSPRIPGARDPSIAERIVDVVRPTYVGLDEDSWASTTARVGTRDMFPAADVPSCNSRSTPNCLSTTTSIWGPIARAAQRRVLIVGSGNVVHNLRLVDFNSPASHRLGPSIRRRHARDHDQRPTELGRPAPTATTVWRCRHPTTSCRSRTWRGCRPRRTPRRARCRRLRDGCTLDDAYELPAA